MGTLICAAALAALASPAFAGSTFAAYEGANSVVTGTGGTKVVDEGIDWWTAGDPPRKFQILGVITDERRDKPLSGKAIGSKSIAKKVNEVGGNAVIVHNQDARASGVVGFANLSGASAFGSSKVVNTITTQLIVIKYQ